MAWSDKARAVALALRKARARRRGAVTPVVPVKQPPVTPPRTPTNTIKPAKPRHRPGSRKATGVGTTKHPTQLRKALARGRKG